MYIGLLELAYELAFCTNAVPSNNKRNDNLGMASRHFATEDDPLNHNNERQPT